MSKADSKKPPRSSAAAKPRAANAPAAKPKAPKVPLDEAILGILANAKSTTLSPPEIAHVLEPDGDWHALLMPIRRAAVALALADRLVIYRKGKPVDDPEDFRGVYRLGLPKQD